MYVALTLLLTLVGQCTSPNCPPQRMRTYPASWVAPSYRPVRVAVQAAPAIEWRPVAGEPGQLARYVNGQQVGSWDSTAKIYRTFDARTLKWGEPIFALTAESGPATAAAPQLEKKELPAKATPEPKTGGVDWDKIREAIVEFRKAAPAPTPAAPPVVKKEESQPVLEAGDQPGLPGVKTGLDWDKVDTGGAKFKLGAEPTSKAVVYESLGLVGSPSEMIPKDKDKMFLAFVSADTAERIAFLKAWDNSPDLKIWKDRIRLKVVAPDDPMLRDRDGTPLWYAEEGLFAVSPDGIPLGKMELSDYESPEQLAGALFKVDPSFDRDQVRDMTRTQLGEPDDTTTIVIICLVFVLLIVAIGAGGIGLALFLYFRKQGDADAQYVVLAAPVD